MRENVATGSEGLDHTQSCSYAEQLSNKWSICPLNVLERERERETGHEYVPHVLHVPLSGPTSSV
jgi:hypothetical protein